MNNNIKTTDDASSEYMPWPKFKFSGKLRPWPRGEVRDVPSHINKPDYASHPEHISMLEECGPLSRHIPVLSDEDISKMRHVSLLAREVLDEAAKVIKVGVTTDEIDKVVHMACIKRNCYPSPLGYYGFPKSVCTSVNEIICHGIPDLRPLNDGDIVNVDVTVYYDQFHGDLNETFLVGNVDNDGVKLIRAAHECLMKAIEIVKPGVPYKEIGNEIHKHADKYGFSVVREYTGHGIHRLFHGPPTVYHYRNNPNKDIMLAGHIFTIEPMINEGSHHTIEWKDDWTVATKDGKRSAQFEQTLLVTELGCEILTARRQTPDRPYFIDQL